MDAEDRKSPRSWIDRIVLGALLVMLVLGLWQGYGVWLLGEVGIHAG